MLSTTILQLMLKDFCNWTRQNPSQKNCASISWENIRSSWVLVTLQLGSNAYYKNFVKLSWDDELPPDIHAVLQWWLELPFLSELKIPRKILDSSGDSVQIHTFSDASQKANGAAAFLRVKHKDRVSVDLVTSKSRVAPLKRSEVFNQSLFLDGLSGQHWIKVQAIDGNPLLRTGFAKFPHRSNSWFHCSGKDNPADLLTRGISVDALTTNSKWWNGSSFLRQIDFQTKGLESDPRKSVFNGNEKELKSKRGHFLDIDSD
ncbi:uncharacterized protein TNCV_1567441 [Trichonephila clavipes]|nr:uncharacterized protein TNCV_1567441 [Trichonephila clavipes]